MALDIIDCVSLPRCLSDETLKASRIEIMLDGISPSSFSDLLVFSSHACLGVRMACGGDVRISVGSVVVGDMMRLVHR